MNDGKADFVLVNARVLTSDPARPQASAVAVGAGRILRVGDDTDARALRGPHTRLIDCEGKTLVPGLIDAHIHLFAFAANLLGVDCSPRAVHSIAEIVDAIGRRASERPPGTWIRAWGYNEFYLAEGRHPKASDLDRAALLHPVRLTHRSGHLSVLNSLAMERLGITAGTPEPVGGVIERDLGAGGLTGCFMEMEEELASRGVPTLAQEELEDGLALAVDRLLALGVTSIHEATPTRSLEHWDLLHELKGRGRVPVRVLKMVGPDDLDGLEERDLFYGAGDLGLGVGAVKIMLNETGKRVLPEPEPLLEQVYAAHRAGHQVAFHAVEEGGIAVAMDAVEGALRRSMEEPRDVAAVGLRLHDHRHRIEHCGVCPPDLVKRMRALGMVVVTQPGFIVEHGERYLAEVPRERQRWLYPVASLKSAGVRLAFGSDCPVAPPDPMVGIGAAVTRRASNGALVGREEAVSARDALALYTSGGAYAGSDEHDRGAIEPGRLADLVLLDGDPTAVEPDAIREIGVEWTMIGGVTVWER